jgi:alkanesulfonate monooxygenase SsuD/methylene tetrahydromethanopterin reductase-like flavin-dependent oxidoreductase (luciferase family)
MMNAGSSDTGRAFAIRHSDMHFDAVETPEASTARVAETKRLARERGRDIQVWTPVGIVCRPTQKEADDYLRHVVDHADFGAIGYLADLHAKEDRQPRDPHWSTAGRIRSRGASSREGPTASWATPTRSHGSSRGSGRRGSMVWPSTSWAI